MGDQLTMEQLLLLNNLMYSTNEWPLKNIIDAQAGTVGDFVNSIPIDQLDDDKDYGSFMTGAEWKQMINAMKNDEQLVNMEIAGTHTALGGSSADGRDRDGGVSAVFVDPDTKEAVVTFRGTAQTEWKDNFIGGGSTDTADGVSTECQKEALEWYQSLDLDRYSTVTVTGHSKGGNKAKYITVMDDSVDRCFSFDGQGFSDEFMKKYAVQISENQNKIINSNVDSDYVNFLLNDIGHTDFYKGYGYGKGGFLENHCPNTFFHFRPDGTYELTPSTRDERIAEVDEFLNNYLRTLSEDDKKETLAMIGVMVEGIFNGEPGIIEGLLNGESGAIENATHNIMLTINLLDYFIRYQMKNSDFRDAVLSLADEFLPGGSSFIISKLLEVLESGVLIVDLIVGALAAGLGFAPEYFITKIVEWFSLGSNGKDIVVPNRKVKTLHVPSLGNRVDFSVDYGKGKKAAKAFSQCKKELQNSAGDIRGVMDSLDGSYYEIKWTVGCLADQVQKEAQQCNALGEAINGIMGCYENAENRILGAAR